MLGLQLIFFRTIPTIKISDGFVIPKLTQPPPATGTEPRTALSSNLESYWIEMKMFSYIALKEKKLSLSLFLFETKNPV
jgi:hypothetical protein